MSQEANLVVLEQQHQALQRAIDEEMSHPGYDDLHLAELKRRKLVLKDEIEKLKVA